MNIWKYRIYTRNGVIITRNLELAEMKSKLGFIVFCKREPNIFPCNQ